MGVFHETEGDNDFASIFPSVAEEKRVKQERDQADLLLKILDELDERERTKQRPSRAQQIEYLRVAPNGDVIRDPIDEEKRAKIMTVDQLPKESEYELLFGKPPEEPQLKIETGMRLRDGKPSQLLKLDDLSLFTIPGNLRLEHIMVFGAALFLILVLLSRFIRSRMARKRQEDAYRRHQEAQHAQVQMQNQNMEAEIERRVRQRLGLILSQVNKNMC